MALLSDHIRHLTDTDPEILFPESLFPASSEKADEGGTATVAAVAKRRSTNRRVPSASRGGTAASDATAGQ